MTAPIWVIPIAFRIANGYESERAVNAIGFTDTNGDLLLYRKLTPLDWDLYPELNGIAECWLTFALPGVED